MNNLNAFHKIGAIGIILTIALHVVLTIVLPDTSVHTSFAVVYPSWIAFFVLGAGTMTGKKSEGKEESMSDV